MVLIIPERSTKPYEPPVLACFDLLGDNLLVYEINMGMATNLRKRAHKYAEYHANSTLYNAD
jgi:hypothetical protein